MDKYHELSIASDAQSLLKKAHSDHVRDLIGILHKTGKGAAPGYTITHTEKG